MKEAQYYIKKNNKEVKCLLCPHECVVSEGYKGICKVRENHGGVLYAASYGQIAALALDPIEKKPLRNYKPGTYILSAGTNGCNFKCDFCQNYHISQNTSCAEYVSPEELVEISNAQKSSIGIAFTYNEPTVWYEYIYDVCKINEKDTVLVTNGFINKNPIQKLLPHIDAMNIDLKSINPFFYRRYCFGDLKSVQQTILLAYENTHIEITYMSIPELNDSEDETIKLTEWIADINKNIPLHIIAFRPMYKMAHIKAQTNDKIEAQKKIAEKRLNYVY